jgi:hypothetical protein
MRKILIAWIIVLMPTLFVSSDGVAKGQEKKEASKSGTSGPTKGPVDPLKNLPPVALGDTISKFGKTLTGVYMPIFVKEIAKPFDGFTKHMAYALALLLACIGGMKLWKKGLDLKGDDLWWMGFRLFASVLLITVCQNWITGLMGLGVGLTYGDGKTFLAAVQSEEGPIFPGDPEGEGGSYLQNKRNLLETSFNETYKRFVEGGFTVKVTGDPAIPDSTITVIKPNPGDIDVVGIIMPNSSEVQDNNWIASYLKGLSPSSWNPRTMFSLLNGSRGFMEVGFLFLNMLIMFTLPILKILAPFYAALITDEEYGKTISGSFFQGVLVFTLVFPFVAIFVEIFSYMLGNIALLGFTSTADGTSVSRVTAYAWDPQTLSTVQQANPYWHIALGIALFSASGFFSLITPFLAYRFAKGDVLGAMVTSVSAVGGAFAAVGISYLSASAGAAIGRTADSLSNTGEKQAADVSAAAARTAAIQSAKGAYAQSRISNEGRIAAANARFEAYTKPGGINEQQANHNTGVTTQQIGEEQASGTGLSNVAEAGERILKGYGAAYGSGGVFSPVKSSTGFVREVVGNGTLSQQSFDRRRENARYNEKSQAQINNSRDGVERSGEVGRAEADIRGAGAKLGGDIKAANTQYAGQMSANRIKHDFAELVSQVRNVGNIVTEVGRSASTSFLGVFDQLNRT